jgi:hypothetical protein
MCKDVMHCQNLSEANGYLNKVRLLDECSNLFWGWAGLCIASKNSADAWVEEERKRVRQVTGTGVYSGGALFFPFILMFCKSHCI